MTDGVLGFGYIAGLGVGLQLAVGRFCWVGWLRPLHRFFRLWKGSPLIVRFHVFWYFGVFCFGGLYFGRFRIRRGGIFRSIFRK